MPIRVTVNESLHKKLNQDKMRNALEKSIKQTMYDLMKASMKEAPPHTDYRKDKSKPRKTTGNLVRSHSIDVRVDTDNIEGLLKNSATDYWSYVQFGTSRMNANDFVTRAFSKVAPSKKVAEYFSKYYKEE